jgi:Zn-dependent protease with chaperone function
MIKRFFLICILVTYSSLSLAQSYWDLRDAFNTNKPTVNLRKQNGSSYSTLTRADLQLIVTTVDKFSLLSGIYPKILLQESNELNAFAGIKDGSPVMIFNKPMYDILVKDRDVAAAVIGHEMAHLYLDHGSKRVSTANFINTIGLIAGIALEILFQQKYGVQDVGFYSGTALATVATNSYSRNQEREADKQGIEWMQKAGFDPEGAVRLFQLFEGRFGNSFLTFLKTHPNPSERVENAKQLVASYRKPSIPDPNPLGLSPRLLALNKKIDEQNIQLIPKSEVGKLGVIAYAKGDYRDSLKYFEKCSGDGEALCKNYLGYQYQFGLGAQIDNQKALSLFREAKSQGLTLAGYSIAITEYQRSGFSGGEQAGKEIIGLIKEAAESGSAQAMGMLSYIYQVLLNEMGEDAIKDRFPDKTTLADYAKLASMRGIPEGYLALGSSYLYGVGVEKDLIKAEDYLARVRKQFLLADRDLLIIAEEKKDKYKIDFYTDQILQKKSAPLLYMLTKTYCVSKSKLRNYEKCALISKEGALMGDPYMGQLYGLLLTNGLGVPKNELDGVAWLYVVQQSGFKLSEGSSRKIQDLNSKDQSRLPERIEELKSLISKSKPPSGTKVESN